MKLKATLFLVCVFFSLMLANMSAGASLMLEYDNGVHEYTGSVYKLKVNGSEVKTPLEPIIFNDRALVPIREVFEAMGATVGYDNGDISVSMNGISVGMSIGDPVASINGKKKTIPDGIVPKLIAKQGESAKTMVPVRFISESIGMDVEFDGADGIINVNSPSSSLTNVSYKTSGNNYIEITAKISGGVNKVTDFTLEDPARVVVDIANTALSAESNKIAVNSVGVTAVRLGETNGTTRIVVDVSSLKSYNVTKTDTAVKISVTTNGENISLTPPPQSTPAPTAKPAPTAEPNVTPAQSGEKIIVIDAGHGGKDGGANGTLAGQTIHEKNLTLSIAKKVEAIVSGAGYRVIMTRTGDTYPELTERSDIANSAGAAMFVSIHINSAENIPSANGTEVYYSVKNNGTSYGATSEQLAENILDGMLARMGTRDRGVKTANHVVTRTSVMPAVLVEVGFISNEAELAKMCDDGFQQNVAQGIADGILKTITKINVPEKMPQAEPVSDAEVSGMTH